MRNLSLCLGLSLCLACSSGSSKGWLSKAGDHPIASSADNVVPIHVDIGMPEYGYINGLFGTVTLCVPGTDECQEIEHVIVDTGSTGLRVMGSALNLKLPTMENDQGVPLAECGQFVGGYTWGPMAWADFKWGEKQIKDYPVHVLEQDSFPVPSGCTGVDVGSVEAMGANGILGIGTSIQDCGPACAPNPPTGYKNPKIYYACSSSRSDGCTYTTMPLEKQLTNPVPRFEQDNNGTVIQLPRISDRGAVEVQGSLVFGIGTRDNNALGDAKVLHLDRYGMFESRQASPFNDPEDGWVMAFIDSGSNGIFFLDSETAGIPICSDSRVRDFYCPTSTRTLLSEARDGFGEDHGLIEFKIANTFELLTQVDDNVAFNDQGAPSSEPQSGSSSSAWSSYFDYGLPFYYGRNVYTSIEGLPTPIGDTPFVAF